MHIVMHDRILERYVEGKFVGNAKLNKYFLISNTNEHKHGSLEVARFFVPCLRNQDVKPPYPIFGNLFKKNRGVTLLPRWILQHCTL